MYNYNVAKSYEFSFETKKKKQNNKLKLPAKTETKSSLTSALSLAEPLITYHLPYFQLQVNEIPVPIATS